MTALRLATRRSALALAQAGGVAATLIAAFGRDVELVEITTAGDVSTSAIEQIGGTGVFVTALRDAVLAGDVDLAVHSYKDLPTAAAPGLAIAAVPPRADPRDVLCCPAGRTLGELPSGARIGTGSPRRAAQLRALGLGLEIVPIRGNVDTRLKKAIDGEVDAVVLAHAGLQRLDRLDAVTEVLDPIQLLPAPAQGALALECRSDDAVLLELLAELDDPVSRATVDAERAVLAALEAGCTAPVGALADVADDELYLRAAVCAPDGSDVMRRSAMGPLTDPHVLGRALASELLDDGAAELMRVLS
ncbi:MAG TPA: hydroxymethylbilane synthase [Mycobacteriales bacterium]|nr:hydroxymethylbilane synthase [Mycobacteriales bacterium]